MKLSRLAREKEEEIETERRKVETLRKDIRASEKQRHDMVVKLEEAQADREREAKLRAKADLYRFADICIYLFLFQFYWYQIIQF